ncbi:hypothetical protein SBV1_2750016 [Verrucomicrobia bacterium]|nr:hypothetical protein SBV1_2750016 [Verrucomicrobiota bacterium]
MRTSSSRRLRKTGPFLEACPHNSDVRISYLLFSSGGGKRELVRRARSVAPYLDSPPIRVHSRPFAVKEFPSPMILSFPVLPLAPISVNQRLKKRSDLCDLCDLCG